ncbi:hypothetical protein C6P40_005078 [Pichia californica]|uniref:Uncharacterized protein n=1 Tax=Pichia californica TaxID=460514 RepID=A0A9P7BCT6_9ASCO|nr:hypothetical protein C6P42_002964 [[Candida] californica]KAG0684605.1 hypothetical protein C6P40_005078 [[Candida] californica]
MTPIAISSLKTASRNMVRLSNRSSKSFFSYTANRPSYTEGDYYNSRYNLNNNSSQSQNQINNNAGGHVENSEMKFVKNSSTSNTSVSDVDETKFVPKVSSYDHVSGSGHNHL